ncbi:TetR/AcrR family transcriptional regulator [Streptomyces sp. UG1]|uniref:TetR/AcrR family transcriptional regulator n=1 Tax=Streptomyces sp. UG1 TaxID=3417652 RepID=UPI003CF828B3
MTDSDTTTALPALTARERILRAAMEEFAEHGFSGARINRIAEAANLNKQLIYHYFDSKDGLYAAVLGEMLTSIHDSVDATSDIRDLMRQQIGNPEARRAWSRMVAWEGLAGDRPVAAAAERQESIHRQVQVIMRLQREGQLATDIDPRLALATIYAVGTARYVIPQLIDFCLGPEASDSEDTMAAWADMITRLLTRRAPAVRERGESTA